MASILVYYLLSIIYYLLSVLSLWECFLIRIGSCRNGTSVGIRSKCNIL